MMPVLDRRDVFVFFFACGSLRKSKIDAAMRQAIAAEYPFCADELAAFWAKNGRRGKFIGFVARGGLGGERRASTTLFVKNHLAGKGRGEVCVQGDGFAEVVEYDCGEILSSSICAAAKEGCPVISEAEVASKCGEKDLAGGVPARIRAARLCVAAAVFAAACAAAAVLANADGKRRAAIAEAEAAAAAQRIAAAERIAAEKARLDAAKEKYAALAAESEADVCDVLAVIFECAGRDARIESVGVSGGEFSLEVRTGDSLRIMENFEGAFPVVKEIKMARSVASGGVETVSFSGSLARSVRRYEGGGGIADEAAFYEREADAVEAKRAAKKALSFSAYAAEVRRELRACGCREQYMQSAAQGGQLALEAAVRSDGGGLLRFLQAARGKGFSGDIASLKSRNGADGELQSAIRFLTGIDAASAEGNFGGEAEIPSFDPDAMKAAFGMAAPQKPRRAAAAAAPRQAAPAKAAPAASASAAPAKTLRLVGVVRDGGGEVIVAKDEVFGTLHKIGADCVDGGLSDAQPKITATVNGERWEVIR